VSSSNFRLSRPKITYTCEDGHIHSEEVQNITGHYTQDYRHSSHDGLKTAVSLTCNKLIYTKWGRGQSLYVEPYFLMTATLRATRIKEENVVGFHVQPHYISQQPAFVMLLLATFILVWSNIEGKRGKPTFTGTSVLMRIVFLKQTLHKSKSSRSSPCTCLPSHIQKTTKHFRHWNSSYPWVKGWGGVRVWVWQMTELPQSLNQYLTAPSVRSRPRPSSVDASSTCHLMMETDPVLITCSFVVSIHSTMHKSRNQHSIWRLHSISVRTKWQVTQPICSIKYNKKKCKTITEIPRKMLHEVTVFTLLRFVSQCNIHTYMHEHYPACSPVGTNGDVKSTCFN